MCFIALLISPFVSADDLEFTPIIVGDEELLVMGLMDDQLFFIGQELIEPVEIVSSGTRPVELRKSFLEKYFFLILIIIAILVICIWYALVYKKRKDL